MDTTDLDSQPTTLVWPWNGKPIKGLRAGEVLAILPTRERGVRGKLHIGTPIPGEPGRATTLCGAENRTWLKSKASAVGQDQIRPGYSSVECGSCTRMRPEARFQ